MSDAPTSLLLRVLPLLSTVVAVLGLLVFAYNLSIIASARASIDRLERALGETAAELAEIRESNAGLLVEKRGLQQDRTHIMQQESVMDERLREGLADYHLLEDAAREYRDQVNRFDRLRERFDQLRRE